MKLLTFAASNSKNSINGKLVTYATEILTEKLGDELSVNHIDLNDYEMPIYSIDRQTGSGVPQQAQDFYAAIGDADAVLISFAEHNGFYTAAYKNLFDWTSRIDMAVYQGKPTVMLATSPGGRGGGNVLNTAVGSAPFFGNEVLASLSVPNFGDNFDTEAGKLTNPELDAELRAAVQTLIDLT
ncbi:MAG: NADPH-dependent FMN reductase [Actinomycetota bacterium]